MILLITMTVVFILCLIFLPKRIPIIEIYTTALFSTFLAALADVFLDVKLDLYGFFNKGVDWEYILIFLIIYPVWGFVVMNYYPFHKSVLSKLIYIAIWTFITGLCEYVALHTVAYYYNGWKLLYSILCYPFIYFLLVLNVRFTRKINGRI
jgi:hypothetical protein